MHRTGSRALLLGGLVGLLAACGEVPGGAAGISGTVAAPAGSAVTATEVFACFSSERDCARVGTTTITQDGASAPYRLSVPRGSYGVSAYKDSDRNGQVSNGDLYGYYSPNPGVIGQVTPPATGVNITMDRLTGTTPAPVRESLKEIVSDK